MNKSLFRAFVAAASLTFFALPAGATTVTYEFSSGVFFPRFYEDGSTASKYEFGLDYDLSGIEIALDETAGTLVLSGSATGKIKERDGTIVGTASSALSLTFSGVDFNPTVGAGNIIALGVAGESTSSGHFAFDLQFDDGRREAERIEVYGAYANPKADHATLGDLAGTSFNLLLRDNGQFDIWVKSLDDKPFSISHDLFKMHGDIHGTAAVPEPGSLVLLGTGALGLLRKRRRTAA